jgi:hypothetical protein
MSKKFTVLQQFYGFRIKGRISVLEATEIAFQKMPQRFSGLDIHRQAARLMLRPSVYPDTVLRCLRLLRKRGKAQFYCVNYVDSIYQKGSR